MLQKEASMFHTLRLQIVLYRFLVGRRIRGSIRRRAVMLCLIAGVVTPRPGHSEEPGSPQYAAVSRILLSGSLVVATALADRCEPSFSPPIVMPEGRSAIYHPSLDHASKAALVLASISSLSGVFAPEGAFSGIEYVSIVAEALAFAFSAKSHLKQVVWRLRPDGSGEVDSFPSGHTTLAFAAAGASLALAIGREELYPYAITSLVAAASTGVLRVASGSHYSGDVIAGALIGSAIGAIAVGISTGWRFAGFDDNTES
jgi:hypothetical protein